MTPTSTTPFLTKEALMIQTTAAIQLAQELLTETADRIREVEEKEVTIKAEKQVRATEQQTSTLPGLSKQQKKKTAKPK